MNDVKVSVIVPAYNVEDYISECLNSIVNQTLDDIEIIVINDGSTDNTGEIIKEFKDNYKNIKIIEQKNAGLSAARNVGVEAATGKYITFVDSDDLLCVDMYERLYSKAESFECDMVMCDIMLYWSEDNTKRFNCLNEDEEKIYKSEELYKLLLTRKVNCQVCNKIYKREIWNSNNIKFEKGKYYEDIIPTFEIVKYVKRSMIINDALYKYRMREGSITAKASEKKIEDYLDAVNGAKENIYNYFNIDEIKEYVMSFNVNYGTYALSMINKTDHNNEKIKQRIVTELKLKEYKLTEVLLSNKIGIRTKIKFILYKVKLYGFLLNKCNV